MWKKNYITEITDTFGLKLDPKEALKLAKKIKGAQILAFPSKKYKQSLFAKLENTYSVDQATDIWPRFSLYQIFWAFASFIFIAGTTLVVFDFRQDEKEPIYNKKVIEKQLQRETYVSESDIDTDWSEQQETEGKKESKTIETIQVQPQSIVPKEIIIEPKQEDVIQQVPTPKIQEEDFESDEIMGVGWALEEDFSPASSSMMMDTAVPEMQDMNFLDICDEYDGSLWEDEIYCFLPNGAVCEEYDIHECVIENNSIKIENNIEINLEELIDQYGQ